MKPHHLVGVALACLAFAPPAHARLGAEVYVVPAASLVIGILAGGIWANPLSRTRKTVVLAVFVCTVLAATVPMALTHLPGTRGIRLVLWWFFLASALLYLPYEIGRIGASLVAQRLHGSTASGVTSHGGAESGPQ